jgi:hypothetical protein
MLRIEGSPEYKLAYTGRPTCVVSIMEHVNGKVARETPYFAARSQAPDSHAVR